ncbi:hypothetical protein SASPL_108748 [Salvia splendens]|uniref:Uncharacterized protein n=1 Tax=Salvia splendens TaxID=180675 RepID=A0A8X9A7R2_SALSN|nr:hypothetical protein SASPL_108748 [Salvia splendens]
MPVTRMSTSSQNSSRTWPRFEAVVCDHGLEADVDALDESVRSKTTEVEALQGYLIVLLCNRLCTLNSNVTHYGINSLKSVFPYECNEL